VREFKFFRGYSDNQSIQIDWDTINRLTDWTQPFQTTTNPAWIVNPGLIQYTPPNYNTITIPNYNITTTPGTGTYTIPYSGTVNTATGFSLTTSNPNGITYTTGGFGGILTTNTATFTSNFK
jgi:hypothetical protein